MMWVHLSEFSVCLFLTLTLVVLDSSFKIEEFLQKMAISLKSRPVEQENHSFLANWPDWALICQDLRRLFAVLSVHLCISVSLPRFPWFHCALSRFPSFSHSACYCPRYNSLGLSLLMRVLSHSDTHHLNRYMVWCGCHEILILCCNTVLFLSKFVHSSSSAS